MLSSDSCPRHQIRRLVISVCPRPLSSVGSKTFPVGGGGSGLANNIMGTGRFCRKWKQRKVISSTLQESLLRVTAVDKGCLPRVSSVVLASKSVQTQNVLDTTMRGGLQWRDRMKCADIGQVVSNASGPSWWHMRRDLTDREGCLICVQNLSPVTSYFSPSYLFFIRCWPNPTIHISLNLTSHRNHHIQATVGNGNSVPTFEDDLHLYMNSAFDGCCCPWSCQLVWYLESYEELEYQSWWGWGLAIYRWVSAPVSHDGSRGLGVWHLWSSLCTCGSRSLICKQPAS